jgi:glycosyltransferase involved in cell wall biosynthesis
VSKILICTQSYYPFQNGIAEVTKNLAEQFVENGYEVVVATQQHPLSNKEFILNGVRVKSFNIFGSLLYGITGSDIEEYIELVKQQDYDILNIHCAQIWVFDVLIDYLEKIDRIKIFTSHGLSLIQNEVFKGYEAHLMRGLNSIDKIVCLSKGVIDYVFFKKNFERKTVVIPNGVSVTKLLEEKNKISSFQLPASSDYVVNISNHTPQKNHSLFFNIARLQKELLFVNIGRGYTTERYHLDKVGIKGGCYYACKLKALTSSNVKLYTDVDRSVLLNLLANAKIFLLSSTWEQFPISILEAMAFGVPWVSTEVGNLKELDGGLTFTSSKDATSKIQTLLTEKEQYKELSRAGKKAIEEMYNWTTISQMYERLFVN